MGNAYYNEGQYARATMKYKRVQVFFEYFFEFDSPAQEEETNQVRLDSITNSAACFLKLNAYAETLEQCEQALKLDKDNVKTLYRQAVALRMRDQEGDLKVRVCEERSDELRKRVYWYRRTWPILPYVIAAANYFAVSNIINAILLRLALLVAACSHKP